MSELENLGGQFRRRRQELGATQGAVATRVGVSRQWLARVEAGTGNPSLQQLLRLCEVLDTTLQLTPRQGLRGALPPRTAKQDDQMRGHRADHKMKRPAVTSSMNRKRPGVGEPGDAMSAHTTDARGSTEGLTTDLDRLLGLHTREGNS